LERSFEFVEGFDRAAAQGQEVIHRCGELVKFFGCKRDGAVAPVEKPAQDLFFSVPNNFQLHFGNQGWVREGTIGDFRRWEVIMDGMQDSACNVVQLCNVRGLEHDNEVINIYFNEMD
jgi:hypothetical protein